MACLLDRISLIIVTWNGDDMLRRCLASIRAIYGSLPETIVVDNANTSSTNTLVNEFPGTTYLPLPKNLGFAGGNNAGYEMSTKEFVILLNNDTEFLSDSVAPLIDFLEAHPNVGAVQGSLLIGPENRLCDGAGFELSFLGQLTSPCCCQPAGCKESLSPRKLLSAGGAFLCLRRTAIDALGGHLFFNEFGSYMEDVDLGIRLGLCGWESWYVPTAPVIHYRSMTSRRFASDAIRAQGICNRWSSLFISFGLLGILRLGLPLIAAYALESLVNLLRLSAKPLRIHVCAAKMLFRNRKFIWKARVDFQTRRTIPDRAFLKAALARPSTSHLRETITALIGSR